MTGAYDEHAWRPPAGWLPLPERIGKPHHRLSPLWKRALRGKKAITKHYRTKGGNRP